MYIEKIEIKKFRVLENMEGNNAIHFQPPGGVTADPETGNVVNVIAGVNGSGKTTLLDLIDYAHSYAYNENNLTNMGTLPVSEVEIGNANKLIVSLKLDSQKNLENLSINGILSGKGKKNRRDGFTLFWNVPEFEGESEESKNDFKNKFIDLRSQIFQYFKFGWIIKALNSQANIPIFGSNGNVINMVEQVIAQFVINKERDIDALPVERKQLAVDEFNKIFEGIVVGTKLKSVDADGGRGIFRVVFSNANNQDVSLKDLSDGEKSLYLNIGELMRLNFSNQVILVDEPETSLHPAWQQKIMKIYSRIGKNNQFIVATHSPQIIANTPYQNLIILKKDSDKIIPFYPNRPPIGTDVNSILDDFMGISEKYPDFIKDLHDTYREKVRLGVEEIDEDAKKALSKLLKYESSNSRFMQEMAIIKKLRRKS